MIWPAWVAQALNVGRVAQALGDEPLAKQQSFQQAQRTATALGDNAGRLRASLGLAQLALQRGQFEAAHTAFSQTLDEARQQQDQPAALAALNGLGLAQIGLGRLPAARQTLAEAEALARSRRDPRLLASTLANQGGLAVRARETDRAIGYLEEAVILIATENIARASTIWRCWPKRDNSVANRTRRWNCTGQAV